MKYIDADKLKAEIERRKKAIHATIFNEEYDELIKFITSLQQEQPEHMIQWTGHNLKEVIDFTGKSPKFGEWFNSWKEFETYVHQHNDILKLFCEDGSHYEVPVGAWIVKTPDGYNLPSVAKYIQQEQQIRESHKGSWIEETKQELQHEEELLDMRLETLKRIRDKKNQFQREQPEEDIWKEIHKYFNPHGMKLQFDRGKGNTILRPKQLFNFARHFAEWGATRLSARNSNPAKA
jgi:hypothetical protein